jgi:hypothetical protein
MIRYKNLAIIHRKSMYIINIQLFITFLPSLKLTQTQKKLLIILDASDRKTKLMIGIISMKISMII